MVLTAICYHRRYGNVLTKTWRVMRLISILILGCCLQISAKSVSQTITLTGTNIKMETIISEVEKQTGFLIVCPVEFVKNARPVDLNAHNQPLEDFIKTLLTDKNYTYSLQRTTIVIKRLPHFSTTISERNISQQPPFQGVIHDKNNKRLAGVNVLVKGTKRGTVSGIDGSFTIEVNENDVLILSSIGYLTQEVKATLAGPLYITLETSSSPLDEVQIIAYGSTLKRLNTGAVGTVKKDVIERQPVSNPLLALTGRVSGLDITQTGGIAGSGVKVRIRGQNSIRTEANDPLYIIDGVPFASSPLDLGVQFATVLGFSGVGGISPFNSLNPADIESIEVLKDADATAIYGSRGANGVILITTKRGKSGKTTVEVNASSGFGKVSRFLDVLDRRDYLDMRYEAFRNDGEDFASDFAFAPDLKEWDTTRNTNWQKELIGGTAKYTNLQASVSGGNSQTTFMVGAGYWKETSVFPGTFSDEKISGRFNVGHTSTDRKFNLQFSSSFVHDKNQLPTTDPTLDALQLPPVAPKPFTEDNKLNWENSTWNNPYSALRTDVTGITTNLVSNIRLQYQLLKTISLAVNGGYNRLHFDNTVLYPYSAANPAYGPPTGLYARSAYFTNTNKNTWNLEPVVEFKSKVGPGILQVLAGTTFQRTYNAMNSLEVNGIPDDALLNNPAAGTMFRPSKNASLYLYNAVFGRINYDLNNKYIINLTARRDGSSRFGPGKQFGNFGAIGAAWLFSKEGFIEDILPEMSFGKLRASYGLIGSDNIADYGYVTNYVNTGQYSRNVIYDGVSGLIPVNHANRNFGWESTRKLDLALELGWFSDRLLLNVNYFRNESSNQLVGYVLPYITGFASVQYNLPATVRNTGLELELNTVNIQRKNFTWKTSFNLTIPRNTLVSYPDLASSSYRHDYIVGKPLTIYKVWDLIRIEPETGLFIYQGANKTETKTPMNSLRDEDRYVAVDLSRRLFGGLGNTITYKRFTLDFFFQFVKQTGNLQKPIYTGHNQNIPQYVWDNHWQKPGDLVGPKFTQTYGETYFNNSFGYDRTFYGDASFIRLKNVLVAYTIPGWLTKGNTTQNLKVYLSGQNLVTFTPYKGLDPETTSTGLPPLTVVMAGLQLTL